MTHTPVTIWAIGTHVTSVSRHFVIVLQDVFRAIRKRDLLSLCLLKTFPVTITLENHGELTAHSRCSINLLVSACGKNIAHEEKVKSQETSLAASTALQKKVNWEKEQEDKLTSLNSEGNQPGSTMLYTAMANKEELERYQDCSWFQGKPSKDCSISKLLQDEAFIPPETAINELDLEMQFASRGTPLWGDEYLGVFDDEGLHCILEDKFGGKESHMYPSDENSAYINHKLGEDGISDLSIYNNYTIRKTDSYDNMKAITSMNMSDITPMSYHEQVNNVNYNLQFNGMKSEVKEELGFYSPDCDSYVMESEDSDLRIGREEVVEVEVHDGHGDDEMGSGKQRVEHEDFIDDYGTMKVDPQEFEYPSYVAGAEEIVSTEKIKIENTETVYNTTVKKEDMKLHLAKNIFEQCLNVSTPELDFMDLIDYINNEMGTSSQWGVEQPIAQNINIPLKESSPNTVATLPVPQDGGNTTGRESLSKTNSVKTVQSEIKRESLTDLGTVNVDEIVESMSIAERIKIGSPRKRPSRFSLENVEPSEDEENRDDDDYEFEFERKRCRSRSRNSQSVSSKCGDHEDSYRERRDRNNEASRRSRQNKKNKERQMFKSREEAERRNAVLRAKADRLEKLVAFLRQVLLQLVQKGSVT